VRCPKRFHQAWASLLIVFTTVGVAPQDKPDFSGRLVLAIPQQSETDTPLALSVRRNGRAHNGTR
jgi:hypothetical protein